MSSPMACKYCGSRDVKSAATAEHPKFNWVRRRRVCRDCHQRWWTIELDEEDLSVEQMA